MQNYANCPQHKSYFDINNQTIIHNKESIQLSTKAFAVLICLCKRSNQIVTKQELLDIVWQDTITVEAVIKNTISEIRKALNDNPKTPRFVQTVHRRGYRFIGMNHLLLINTTKNKKIQSSTQSCKTVPESLFVGRDNQLAIISNSWEKAQNGKCVRVMIKGDPGVGKSALVQSWLQSVNNTDNNKFVIAQSRCIKSIQRYPYITLLECLEQICNSNCSELARNLLANYSPGILNKLNQTNTNPITSTNLKIGTESPGSEELLLQATRFFEHFIKDVSLIWSIDDAQNCDKHTLALIEYLILQNNSTNFMILMTQCDWQSPGKSNRVSIDSLHTSSDQTTRFIHLPVFSQSEINDFVSRRSTILEVNPEFANQIYEMSCGHPLIVKSMMDSYLHNKYIEFFPMQVQKRLNIELNKLKPEFYRLLQTASVVVVNEFSAAAIASLLNMSIIDTENYCEQLAISTGWIERRGSRVWPDGTVAQLYKFTHMVYRDFLYQTLSAAQKQILHLQHAKRLELAYDKKVNLIAKNLIYHYQRGWCNQGAERYQKLVEPKTPAQLHREVNLKPYYHKSKHLQNSLPIFKSDSTTNNFLN